VAQVQVVFEKDVESDVALREAAEPQMRQLSQQISRWVDQQRAVTNRSSLFDRAAYAPSDNPYDQMRTARAAVKSDDIVGGIAEVTEGMAFDGVKWESNDPDEADVFNQISAEMDLDQVVRQMHRELFTYSQVYMGFWWGQNDFTVRGKSEKGNKRKKTYSVWYPQAITTFDATRCVPVGMMQFGQERLAWQATPQEIALYSQHLDPTNPFEDQLMERFYDGQYLPTDPDEIYELSGIGVDIHRLILLKDDIVKRHCLTRQDYMRFPDIRLRRTFKLLDLKQQLMEADRVTLIGAANYILLVRKGSKEDPAYPEEIQNLKENFNYIAKLPVIISDHRLEIDIITPKQDAVLNPERYDVLDNRIAATCLGLFGAVGSRSGNRGDTSLQEGRLVARALENRRHMIRRFLEREISKAVYEHPRNRNVFEGREPNLTFVPNHIALDDDAGMATSIISLRTMNEISRESTLEYFGFDQEVEAMRRELEKASGMDDTFETVVPFSSPGQGGPGGGGAAGAGANARSQAPAAQGTAGSRGGRPTGGGKPSQNPTAAPRRTSKGTTKPSGS